VLELSRAKSLRNHRKQEQWAFRATGKVDAPLERGAYLVGLVDGLLQDHRLVEVLA
jgi:hypothetical protein